MGLLLSDTTLIDPLLDDTVWLRDGPGVWAYAPDASSAGYDQAVADPVE
jgi:hypothetical protein